MDSGVAPRAGAWIETKRKDQYKNINDSRAPRGRVD